MKVFLFCRFPKFFFIIKKKSCDKTNLLRFGGEKILNGLGHSALPWTGQSSWTPLGPWTTGVSVRSRQAVGGRRTWGR